MSACSLQAVSHVASRDAVASTAKISRPLLVERDWTSSRNASTICELVRLFIAILLSTEVGWVVWEGSKRPLALFSRCSSSCSGWDRWDKPSTFGNARDLAL